MKEFLIVAAALGALLVAYAAGFYRGSMLMAKAVELWRTGRLDQ